MLDFEKVVLLEDLKCLDVPRGLLGSEDSASFLFLLSEIFKMLPSWISYGRHAMDA